jgi:hypothetical protein
VNTQKMFKIFLILLSAPLSINFGVASRAEAASPAGAIQLAEQVVNRSYTALKAIGTPLGEGVNSQAYLVKLNPTDHGEVIKLVLNPKYTNLMAEAVLEVSAKLPRVDIGGGIIAPVAPPVVPLGPALLKQEYMGAARNLGDTVSAIQNGKPILITQSEGAALVPAYKLAQEYMTAARVAIGQKYLNGQIPGPNEPIIIDSAKTVAILVDSSLSNFVYSVVKVNGKDAVVVRWFDPISMYSVIKDANGGIKGVAEKMAVTEIGPSIIDPKKLDGVFYSPNPYSELANSALHLGGGIVAYAALDIGVSKLLNGITTRLGFGSATTLLGAWTLAPISTLSLLFTPTDANAATTDGLSTVYFDYGPPANNETTLSGKVGSVVDLITSSPPTTVNPTVKIIANSPLDTSPIGNMLQFYPADNSMIVDLRAPELAGYTNDQLNELSNAFGLIFTDAMVSRISETESFVINPFFADIQIAELTSYFLSSDTIEENKIISSKAKEVESSIYSLFSWGSVIEYAFVVDSITIPYGASTNLSGMTDFSDFDFQYENSDPLNLGASLDGNSLQPLSQNQISDLLAASSKMGAPPERYSNSSGGSYYLVKLPPQMGGFKVKVPAI